MRQTGRPWKEIFSVLMIPPAERESLRGKASYLLEHKNRPIEPDTGEYGAAGLCRRCYAAYNKRLRELMKQSRALQGRNTFEETIALTLREDSAALLLSCNEAQHQKIRGIALQRYAELRKEKPTITN